MSISSSWLWGVDRGAFIGHLSNKSIVVVSSVGGGLDPDVRKSSGERSGNFALSILSLRILEVVLRVVISYSIFIGKWLRGELLLLVCRGGVVGCRGAIGWGAVSGGSSKEGGGNQELKDCETHYRGEGIQDRYALYLSFHSNQKYNLTD
jgi:hypothetical protein